MAFHLKALLASGALLVSTGAALAASGIASTNVNVRSGPGQEFRVIDVLPRGETVNMIGCDDVWCEISMGRDGTGYALAEMFDFRGRPPFMRFGGGGGETVVIEEDDPVVIRGLTIGGYWDSRPYYIRDGYYYWGGRWYGGRPGVGRWRDRSWRRWDDRRGWGDRPGDSRGGVTNRPPRVDPPRWTDRPGRDRPGDVGNRPPRVDDPRFGRGDDRGRGDRGGRGDRDRGRIEGEGRAGDGRMNRMERVESRPEPRDRGDRMGLDRAGGGRGGDGGGRGGGREGGGREGGRGER